MKMKTVAVLSILGIALTLSLTSSANSYNLNEEDATKKSKRVKAVVKQDSTYLFVDTPAQFMRGQSDLQTFVDQNLKASADNQVIVKIRFVIERYGSVSNLSIIEGTEHAAESKAALEVTRNTLQWRPARINEYAVGSVNELTFEFNKKTGFLSKKTLVSLKTNVAKQ
jgi:hypothetical protein